jgi:hypothetical protein
MKLNVKTLDSFFDETGKSQVIDFPFEQITIEELITRKVHQEVQSSSSQPPIQHVQAALTAFESNGYVILINNQQETDLDSTITITPNTSIVFIKLTPIVGG